MNIKLDLTKLLRPWQKVFFENAIRYNVLVVHRRAGKTAVAVLFLIYKALQNKGNYGYIAPFRSQAKSIAWEMLIKFASQIPDTNKNISELYVDFPNGSRITLFGADNQDALRGLDLKGVVLDEYAQMSKTIYSEIIFPMINAHRDGFTTWIGTPKGKNSFYELYQKAIHSSKYYTMYLDVYSTDVLNDEQILEAQSEQNEDSFKQEYLLDWDVAIKGSYYGKAIEKIRNEGHMLPNLYDRDYLVYTAWDLGIDDSTVILFFQYIEGKIRIIDEFDDRGQGFPYYKEIVYSKPYKYKIHFLPHDIMVKEMGTGLTRLETFQRLFSEECQKLTRFGIEDGINMVRELLPNMYFDTSLEDYLNILTEYRPTYNDKTGLFGKPMHCDFSDALRYLATAYNHYVQTFEDYEHFTVSYDDLLY